MSTVGLVDASFLFRRNWHAQEASAEVNSAAQVTLAEIKRYVDRFDAVAVCCDTPPYLRAEIDPQYKANREAPSELMMGQLRSVIERCDADGLHILRAKGYEADDVIATATAQLLSAGHTVSVVSPDKDLAQLVSDFHGVDQISPSNGGRPETRYDEVAVVQKFGVPVAAVKDWLTLVGDKSDNIPGAPGVGAVKAVALLTQWGSLDFALENLGEVKPPAVKKAIEDNRERLLLSRKLITLMADAPIDSAVIFTKKELKKLSTKTYEEEERDAIQAEEIISGPPVQAAPAATQAAVQPATDTQIIRHETNGHTAPVKWNDGLEPVSLVQTFKFAAWVHESRMFPQFTNAEAIGTAIVLGRELGLGAISALSNIHMIQGRPTMGAHLIISKVMQHPDCEHFEYLGGDATFAEYETKRRNNKNATRLKYTIAQAQAAGLVKQPAPGKEPGPWLTRPDEMLRKTCGVKLARIVYPEAASGIYSTEELG